MGFIEPSAGSVEVLSAAPRPGQRDATAGQLALATGPLPQFQGAVRNAQVWPEPNPGWDEGVA